MDPVASYGRFWPKKCIEQTKPAGECSGASNTSRCASWLHSCEAPLSETTVHDSSCRSIGLARGHRDGDDQHAWAGRRLPCRGRPPSHDILLMRGVLISCRERRARRADVQAVFCRRRHQPSRPPLAKIRPGRPAPTMGPGTAVSWPLISPPVKFEVWMLK
jgi:hypothetical protein